ncbi:hypothetical protein EIP91_002933 [Steccherinum ochraceum]|uniref:F-box domain-containing protein n=1 Tax=Steccherinum ochraceum TaxID=92696 RepID=A0A4R0RN39_9APHY|nr:hypothetical protein EIP91_002933 [Steccherinum ochraceum]
MTSASLAAPSARSPASFTWTFDQTNSPPPYYDEPETRKEDATAKDEDCGSFYRGPASFFSQSEPARIPTIDPARHAGTRRPASSNLSIPHLREALSSLESKMATLLSERDEIESRLEQAVRLQSPVHRLPNELLASIFIIGVLTAEEEDSLMLSALMLVCRHWKDVTLATPILWSRIVAGTRHSVDKARRKLERSQSVPLHVLVDFSPRMEHGTVTTESIVNTMDLLCSSIWRWESFRLTIPNRPQAHAALSRCREEAPLLETLSIHILHSMQEDHYSHAPLPLFAGHIPRLSSCSITSFNFGWDQKLLTGLRVLKLGGYWNGFSPSSDIILNILRACPKLEEFALRNMSDVEADRCVVTETAADGSEKATRSSDAKAIHLPRLTSLSFYYAGIARTHTIMSVLSLPALEKVELCFLDDVSPVIEHLRRQSLTYLPLKHLRIESSFFSELKLVRLLHRLPSLTSLELVDVEDASSHLFKSMSTPAGASTWICPKLAHLVLEGCTAFDWDSLRSFVESRLPAHSRAYPTQQRTSVSSASQQAFLTPEQFHASALSSSSASAYAARAQILAHAPVTAQPRPGSVWPQRLDSIDLVRCHQVTKEMVQWMRMYVSEVKCETAKNVWG